MDILIGSMSTGLATGGGFVAGSSVVCTHQVGSFSHHAIQWSHEEEERQFQEEQYQGKELTLSESTRPHLYSRLPSPPY